MRECGDKTRSGQACKGIAIDSSGLCHAHHPDRADARRRAASKGGKRGGRGRPMIEVANLKEQLSDLYTSVLVGVVPPNVGAVAAQVAGARIRLVETERRIKETEELEERIEALEAGEA